MFLHLDEDGAGKNKYQPAASVAVHVEQWSSCAVRIKDQRVLWLCTAKPVLGKHTELHATGVTQAVFTPSACHWDVSIIG